LIDGFPRNEENYNAWMKDTKEIIKVEGVLMLQCDEDEMINRVLKRN